MTNNSFDPRKHICLISHFMDDSNDKIKTLLNSAYQS